MKILILILAFINGGFMLVDGIFVIVNGKYIGPEKPGPWANLFYKLNINVYSLGPLFIVFGLVWLAFVAGFLTDQTWAYTLGFVISILTLWYLPVGTAISLIIFVLLWLLRR